MDAEQKIFSLMVVAQDNQQAVQIAIDGLADVEEEHRKALQTTLDGLEGVKEEHRKTLQAAIDGLAAEREAFARERIAFAQAVQGIQKAAGEAGANAVRQSLGGVAEKAVAAFSDASKPFMQDVRDLTVKANEASTRVKIATRWITTKVFALGLGCIIIVGVTVGLAVWSYSNWEVHQATEKVAQLKNQATEWEKKAGSKAKLSTCGPQHRVCVEVDKEAGPFGEKNTWMVIKGY